MKAGIQYQENETWIPAFAGMTSFLAIFLYDFQSAKMEQSFFILVLNSV
jgi:hypothetical protein